MVDVLWSFAMIGVVAIALCALNGLLHRMCYGRGERRG
jgi:hypothetical protein